MTQEMTNEQRLDLNIGKQAILAILCLCSGVAPLAARWIPGDIARISYGLLLTAIFLALTLLARKVSTLQPFWELPFAFFIFAFVQVLNNSIPRYFGIYILHEAPVPGNPFASTVLGTVIIQLLETVIAIVPIIVLTKASGRNLDSIYARTGKLGRWFIFALVAFVIIYALTVRGVGSRFFPTHGALTPTHVLALTPALLVLVISNGFQEEFLFRGLFLQKFHAFFGIFVSNLLQAIIFSIAHAGVTYTPIALLFIVVIVFPLGLFAGYLMRTTNGVIVPAIFHAAVDIPIYLAFLSYVS
jgi:membrane protease YdiL (CAAX protease family)